MAYLQRASELYISKNPESTFNTPVTTGANFLKATNPNTIALYPELEKRTDLGRAGSEFASTQCNTYWLPPGISIADEANFDLYSRLSLRGVGGTVTDTTVVSSAAYKHSAPMLASSSGLQLPGSTVVTTISGSGATWLYAGCVVNQMRMSQDGTNPVQIGFELLGTGKHRTPHAVTSLPSTPSFSCLSPYAFVSFNNGSAQDLATNCQVRSWSIELANNHNPTDDRCIGDTQQIRGDYTTTSGTSASPYVASLNHGDRTVTAEVTVLLDSTLTWWQNMADNTALTNITFGVRGAVLDAGGPTYEYLKWIIPNGYISRVQQVDSNGKAAVNLQFQATTSSTSILTVEVVNSTASSFS